MAAPCVRFGYAEHETFALAGGQIPEIPTMTGPAGTNRGSQATHRLDNGGGSAIDRPILRQGHEDSHTRFGPECGEVATCRTLRRRRFRQAASDATTPIIDNADDDGSGTAMNVAF